MLIDGFVTFPAATFAIDPAGWFQAEGNDVIKSAVQPFLYGVGAATYTRRYGRWLPASIAAVSPDSSHYAYAEFYNDSSGPRSRIHVVDVASASDRVAMASSITSSMAFTFSPSATPTRPVRVCGG